jgi:hypothetical protein
VEVRHGDPVSELTVDDCTKATQRLPNPPTFPELLGYYVIRAGGADQLIYRPNRMQRDAAELYRKLASATGAINLLARYTDGGGLPSLRRAWRGR